jgi:hypothetical protein
MASTCASCQGTSPTTRKKSQLRSCHAQRRRRHSKHAHVGFQHLCADILCILQDSDQALKRNLSRRLTSMLKHAPSLRQRTESGCFRERNWYKSAFVSLDVRLPVCTMELVSDIGEPKVNTRSSCLNRLRAPEASFFSSLKSESSPFVWYQNVSSISPSLCHSTSTMTASMALVDL